MVPRVKKPTYFGRYRYIGKVKSYTRAVSLLKTRYARWMPTQSTEIEAKSAKSKKIIDELIKETADEIAKAKRDQLPLRDINSLSKQANIMKTLRGYGFRGLHASEHLAALAIANGLGQENLRRFRKTLTPLHGGNHYGKLIKYDLLRRIDQILLTKGVLHTEELYELLKEEERKMEVQTPHLSDFTHSDSGYKLMKSALGVLELMGIARKYPKLRNKGKDAESRRSVRWGHISKRFSKQTIAKKPLGLQILEKMLKHGGEVSLTHFSREHKKQYAAEKNFRNLHEAGLITMRKEGHKFRASLTTNGKKIMETQSKKEYMTEKIRIALLGTHASELSFKARQMLKSIRDSMRVIQAWENAQKQNIEFNTVTHAKELVQKRPTLRGTLRGTVYWSTFSEPMREKYYSELIKTDPKLAAIFRRVAFNPEEYEKINLQWRLRTQSTLVRNFTAKIRILMEAEEIMRKKGNLSLNTLRKILREKGYFGDAEFGNITNIVATGVGFGSINNTVGKGTRPWTLLSDEKVLQIAEELKGTLEGEWFKKYWPNRKKFDAEIDSYFHTPLVDRAFRSTNAVMLINSGKSNTEIMSATSLARTTVRHIRDGLYPWNRWSKEKKLDYYNRMLKMYPNDSEIVEKFRKLAGVKK